jgi:hypothetical protein
MQEFLENINSNLLINDDVVGLNWNTYTDTESELRKHVSRWSQYILMK